MISSTVAAKRKTKIRACRTNRPAVLKTRKRSRLGRARNNSAGSASRFRSVGTLCAITTNRNQAAFAPKSVRPLAHF
jgi:hypothetical protein